MVGEGYATVIGSGGVLIQFTLAALGLPLATVVATDIGAAQGADWGILVATKRSVWKNKRTLLMLAAPTTLGGIVGTTFLISIPLMLLKIVLIIGLSALLAYVLVGPKTELAAFENIEISARQYPLIFTVMFVLGVYGNVSGVGVGTFAKFAYLSLLRISFVESLGIASIIALPAAVYSVIVTGISGLIAWSYFAMIFIGAFLGANFVAKHVRKIPEAYLRGLLLVVITLYLLYLVANLFT